MTSRRRGMFAGRALVVSASLTTSGFVGACVGGDPVDGSSRDDGGSTDAPVAAANANDAGADPTPDAAPDANAPAPPCDLTKDFEVPTAQPFTAINTAAAEEAAWLTSDELTVYFSAVRGGTFDIFRSTRTSIATAFSAATPVAGAVNVPGVSEEHGPVLSPDELTMYLTKMEPGASNAYDIFVSTRASTTSVWSASTLVGGLETVGNQSVSSLLAGDMWFGSEGGIFRAPKAGSGFGTPIGYAELGADARDPVLAPDGLTIYYSHNDGTGVDIWRAVRADTAKPFTQTTKLPNVNTGGFDAPSWLSPDECRLYITVDAGATARQLMVASRPTK